MKRLLIILIASCLMGCASVPAYNGHNQTEINEVKAFNKKWYWIAIGAIAIAPYTINSSTKHPCRPHEDCYDPIN